MLIIGKTKNECKSIEFACPFDSRIEEREKDKMKDYNNLKRKFKKIWDMPVNSCSIRCIRSDTKEIKVVFGIAIETRIVELQKITILYSARIDQNVLEV